MSAALTGVAAAGVSAAAGAASSAVSEVRSQKKWEKRQKMLEQQQIRAEQRQFDYNKQLQDYVYGQNLEQWNRENAYNSPAAQMSRFQNAGLNANLIYGSENLAANSPTMQIGDVGGGAPPVSGEPSIAPTGFDYLGGAALDIQKQIAEAQIDKMNAETIGILSDNDFKDASFNTRLQQAAENLLKTQTETANISQDTSLKSAETEGQIIKNTVDENIAPTKIKQAEQDLENSRKTEKLIAAETASLNMDTSLKKVQKRIMLLDEKIKSVDAANADTYAELRKQRETVAISYANNQNALLKKELRYYDATKLAELSLSAADRLNKKAFAGLAESRKSYQDYVNKMNEILLDPTVSTDASTYFSALLLKNINETSFMDIMKTVLEYSENSDGEKKNNSMSEDEAKSALQDVLKKLADKSPTQRQQFSIWFDQHQNSSFAERLEIARQMLGE